MYEGFPHGVDCGLCGLRAVPYSIYVGCGVWGAPTDFPHGDFSSSVTYLLRNLFRD